MRASRKFENRQLELVLMVYVCIVYFTYIVIMLKYRYEKIAKILVSLELSKGAI